MENNIFSQLYCWKCLSRLYLCVFVIGSVTTGYNLDLKNPVIRKGTRNTYFGYSVAIHSEGEDDMMIVGAPRGDSNITGITEGGAIYRCPLVPYDYQGECQLLVLETQRSDPSLNRSHQWLGATVKSSGGTGKVLNGNFVLGGPGRSKGTENDAYLGYTVAQGTQGLDVVTGAPRGGRLMGKVYIFKVTDTAVKKHQQLTGQQFGSYFGHCVAIMDLNNDGLDDLIVGAPNYWNKETHQINVGQVYVYYQTAQGNLDEEHKSIITGQVTNGRFGFTVAPLGDVNDDGFNGEYAGKTTVRYQLCSLKKIRYTEVLGFKTWLYYG
ncbi:Integrin alpha-8 [Holothuria leucospilota]|uniref:Integrin alpha-8 n=1 Tax=Holothuria leucospilota TaxID=206669 RepID=A0A9Q0YLL6_HOLLE|nr:Integrin alpha-8 [Holothuria leucospilota]